MTTDSRLADIRARMENSTPDDVRWLLAYANGAVSTALVQQERIKALDAELEQARAEVQRQRDFKVGLSGDRLNEIIGRQVDKED